MDDDESLQDTLDARREFIRSIRGNKRRWNATNCATGYSEISLNLTTTRVDSFEIAHGDDTGS